MFHVLPTQGGLFDQDYLHLKKMVKVLEATEFAEQQKREIEKKKRERDARHRA